MKDDRIQAVLEKNLSHISLSDAAHEKMYREITEGECRMKNKVPVVFAVTMILILVMTGSALAAGIADWVSERMQPYADTSGWGLEQRLAFLHLMQDWGVEVDSEKLAELEQDYAEKKEHMTLDELDELEDRAGEMIYAWYFPLAGPFEAIQQEKYPMPSPEVLYTYLYRTQSPDASDEEIAEAFDAWRTDWQNSHKDSDRETNDKTVEETIRESFESWLYERLYISEQELRRFEITLRYNADSDTWRAMGKIDQKYLEASQIEHFIWLAEDEYRDGPVTDGQSMFWYCYYDAAGNYLGENLEQYEFDRLIPSAAYATDNERMKGQVTRVFRNFSLEQRAAFSQAYKPVVDAWLQAHPDYAAYLEAQDSRDSTYAHTRHWYGLPSEGDMQAEEISELAWRWFLNQHPDIPETFFEEYFDLYLYYVVNDDGDAEWKARIYCDSYLRDTSAWGEEERSWDRTAEEINSVVFDTAGNILREDGNLLPEDQYEYLW